MHDCIRNPASCNDSQDCMKNLEFVRTTNGGYDYNKERNTMPTGDCVVIATSIATGLGYVEAQRRLFLLANSLKKHRDALAAIPEQTLGLGVPVDIADRSPIHGTHLMTCNLFLIAHFFDRRNGSHCLFNNGVPYVVTGITDDDSLHAVAVNNGQAYGTYDVTDKDFDVIDVWACKQELLSTEIGWLAGEFTNQRRVNAYVKRRLLPDQHPAKPERQRGGLKGTRQNGSANTR